MEHSSKFARRTDAVRTLLLDGEIQASGGALSMLIFNGPLIAAAPQMTPASAEAMLVLPVARPGWGE